MAFLEFFKRQVLIAHISGIPVRVDYRWFFVLALMSWITVSELYSQTKDLSISLVFGLITTLILFASILFHELAHAFVARSERVEVLEIVIHPFGGLARLRREPDTPRAEFRIAVAGPVASFFLALVFLGLMMAFGRLDKNILTPLSGFLALWNFLLAVFNLFPGYPLDGGRVLRALLWHRGRDLNEATILTGRFGQIIGVVLIIFGLFIALARGDFFTGFWTILVGLFLYDSAKSIIKETNNLENLLVEDVMTLPVSVEPDANVMHFVDNILPLHRRTIFLVAKNRQLYGILSLEDIKPLPREAWHITRIQKVMRPITTDYFVEPDTLLADARELMRTNGIGALGVIDEKGNLVGFLQRSRKTKKK
ncbi:MAG: site-2 protease family protein [Pyrinomonadaceae bacterium]